MVLKDMKLEELELMSYTDLTYKILKEEKKPLNTPTIFHHICDLLGYSNEEFEDKIDYLDIDDEKKEKLIKLCSEIKEEQDENVREYLFKFVIFNSM